MKYLKRATFSIWFLCLAAGIHAQENALTESIERGNLVYASNCVACHMANGEGLKGVFPPLVETKILSDLPMLVKALVKGVNGPTTVRGVNYDGLMSGFPLSDEQTADLINDIRNSWGNSAPPVKPDDIQAVLQKLE